MPGELQDLIARVRKLATLPAEVAPEVADVVLAELQRTIAAGTDPLGQPWQPTQRGTQPLQNAAQHVFVAPVGDVVWIRLTGIEVRHHSGTARGRVRRQVVPDSEATFSPRMADAVRDVIVKHCRAALGDTP